MRDDHDDLKNRVPFNKTWQAEPGEYHDLVGNGDKPPHEHNWQNINGEWICLRCGIHQLEMPPVQRIMPVIDGVIDGPLQSKQEAGLRYDADKVRFDLIPPDALFALAEVYTKGAKKYADRNWEKGMSWGRCFGSLMRHCWKWWAGEEIDEETGCHHMAMAAWNCFALFCYATRKVGTDDRPSR